MLPGCMGGISFARSEYGRAGVEVCHEEPCGDGIEVLVGACARKQPGRKSGTDVPSTNYCGCNVPSTNYSGCNDVAEIKSLNHDKVRRKAVSYLNAAKGLLKKVNKKVNHLDHFVQLT